MNFIKKKLFDDFFPNFIHVEFEHELEPGDLGGCMLTLGLVLGRCTS